ncbi:SiaB family protein kinase [Paludibacterium paludis]|uniref:Uncharacterized protein n=1 Tax=Paludibacterium paludis TaxID=1225769 RepID=A0A918U6M3_9NEIS|nr:SiaB family protein kinase [Paludibacterium paludis]GGY03461.1 hypothetical protein GCM10011289_02200 [Paludibacterium paludis]
MLDHYRRFRELADSHKVIFFYTGTFSQAVISAMAETLRTRLTAQGLAGVKQRRLYSSFIEMAQNIVHYSADTITDERADDHELRNGQILIGEENGTHFIVCGNRIAERDMPRLARKLDVLRAMSREDIKALYRDTLRADNEAASKGAGLGFITLARDASEPIEYHFEPSGQEPAFVMFYLKAII